MWRGEVVSIHIARSAAEPMMSLQEARAVAGRGLEGDRFFSKTGTWSGGRLVAQVTLIELETIETLKRDHGVEFGLGHSRRNIVTRGVPLTHLVGPAAFGSAMCGYAAFASSNRATISPS